MATRNDHIRRQRSSGTLQGSGTAIAGANKATWSSQEAAPPPHSTFGLHMSAMCTHKCASIKSSSVDRMNVDFLLWKKCGYLMTGVLILYPALRRVERGSFFRNFETVCCSLRYCGRSCQRSPECCWHTPRKAPPLTSTLWYNFPSTSLVVMTYSSCLYSGLRIRCACP